MRKQVFTLVELLVVVAIISILASMLLPALGKARQKAVTVSCLSIMRQMALCDAFYAQENDDYVTPETTLGDGKNWYRLHWPYARALYVRTGFVHDTAPGTDAEGAVPMCPASYAEEGITIDGWTSLSPWTPSKVAWSYTLQCGGYGRNAFCGNNTTWYNMYHTKLTKVRRPARKVLLMDARYFSIYYNSDTKWDNPTNGMIPWRRHQSGWRVNSSFADGHVEAFPYVTRSTTTLHDPFLYLEK